MEATPSIDLAEDAGRATSMLAYRNRSVCLNAYPEGVVDPTIFSVVEQSVRALEDGEVLIKVHYTTIDPAMRVFMDPNSLISGNKNRADKFVRLGQVIHAWIVGEVVESRSARFPEGSFVRDIAGDGGIQDYCILPETSLCAVDPDRAPLSANVTVLGMPGLTAYFGMVDVGRPSPGGTVVISAAAGGVGGVAGQIAKILGCRTIGIAGGEEKCRYVVEELGFDACIDHKAGGFAEALDANCPDRIDVYFDNIGGDMLDTCLTRLATGGCVVGCGAIATYSGETRPLYNWTALLARQARFEAFSYLNIARDAERMARATETLAGWLASGAIRQEEQVFEGLDSFGTALRQMYDGNTMGKAILKV